MMGTATIVELPKLYENMSEVTVGHWNVAIGQKVASGDTLVELITEKTVEDFASPRDGVLLAIFAESKSVVPAGYALCAIGEAGDTVPDVAAANAAKVAASRQEDTLNIDVSSLFQTASASKKPTFQAAPSAKALARQLGIDLADVAAFCKRKLVHRQDVEAFANQQLKTSSQPPASPMPASSQRLPSSPGNEPSLKRPLEVKNPTESRVALVTGGSGDIGSAVVRALASKGFAVAFQYCKDAEKAEKLVADVKANGGEAWCVPNDLTGSENSCKLLIDNVLQRYGRVDALVNCAGILQDAMLAFMEDDAWNKVLELDLNVPFRLIRAVAMEMARRRWGRIVNITSDAGRMGSAHRANYASAKEGLVGLTRSAALELAGSGIRVNAVSPGFVESRMTANIPELRRKELLKQIPVHRFARPEEVASLVAFLCSEEADYITGQVISVNGGLCC